MSAITKQTNQIHSSVEQYITFINSTLDSKGLSRLNNNRNVSSVGKICASWLVCFVIAD
jgi:hypothetical protein